jgi:hypothetical protein
MGFKIIDGTGAGYKVEVTSGNRLKATSIVLSESKNANAIGESFLISSGYVTYTVATNQALLYVKNNENRDLIIDRFNFNLQASTGGAVDYGRFVFYKNPTSITNGTAKDAVNLNFGSSVLYDIDAEYGNGSTSAFVGGTTFASPLVGEGEVFFIEGNIVLPKGTSIGISYIPPAGNTSQAVAVALNIFKSEEI